MHVFCRQYGHQIALIRRHFFFSPNCSKYQRSAEGVHSDPLWELIGEERGRREERGGKGKIVLLARPLQTAMTQVATLLTAAVCLAELTGAYRRPNKCSLCLSVCLSVSVCMCANQGGTNPNSCTQRLRILYATELLINPDRTPNKTLIDIRLRPGIATLLVVVG